MICFPPRPAPLLAAATTALALLPTPLVATTWYVPSQCSTIQAGIDSATAGDTVLVACGTYHEDSISLKSGVYLASETLQAECVTIDPNQIGSRVFSCADVDSTAWVIGFTITAAAVGDWGGGMYLLHSAPNLVECTFINNSATSGGGVYCEDSSPSFTDCRFEENTASFYGGGLHADTDSDPLLIGCEFIANSAQSSGGGLAATELTMMSCLFTGNSSQSFAGGAFVSSACIADDCSFSVNTAGSGGGLSSVLCTLSKCSFATNSASGHGGGVYSTNCNASDCCFLENTASLNGGALRCADASLERCIIAGNSANDGGGVYCRRCPDCCGISLA
jgi:predicted outer membrane repeat protein